MHELIVQIILHHTNFRCMNLILHKFILHKFFAKNSVGGEFECRNYMFNNSISIFFISKKF